MFRKKPKPSQDPLLFSASLTYGALTGAARGTDSTWHYGRLINQLKNPSVSESPEEKKVFALRICNEHIKHLTNRHCVEVFNALRNKVSLKYIQRETGCMSTLCDYGHTDTYKEIVGLLKGRVNQNYNRHTGDEHRLGGDDLQEDNTINELMEERRGRLPNIGVKLGINIGEEGRFRTLLKHRYGV